MQTEQSKHLSLVRWTLIAVLALYAFTQFMYGETLLVSGGFGWDGQTYRYLVDTFPQGLIQGDWFDYYLTRSVPSIVVNLGIQALNLEINDTTVLQGFRIYGLILFILSGILWGQITRLLNLGVKGTVFAFAGLFLNVYIAKTYFYAPVSTDATAFFLGILMLYLYLRHQMIGLLLVTFIGAFAWNIFIYCGLILFIFPYEPQKTVNSADWRLRGIIAAVVALTIAGYVRFWSLEGSWLAMLDNISPPSYRWFSLSAIIVGAYLFVGIYTLLNNRAYFDIPHIFRQLHYGRIIIAALTFGVYTWLPSYLGQPAPAWLDSGSLLISHFVSGRQHPGITPLANVIIYGAVIFVIAFRWQKVIQKIHAWGLGMSILALAVFLLSAIPEARLWANMFPFAVLLVSLVVDDEDWSLQTLWGFIWIGFILSKIWYQNNYPVWGVNDPINQYPAQNFFMSAGPYISQSFYIIHVIVLLILGVVLWWMLSNPQRQLFNQQAAAFSSHPIRNSILFGLSLLLMMLSFTEVVRWGLNLQMPSPAIIGENDFSKAEPIQSSRFNPYTSAPNAQPYGQVIFDDEGYSSPRFVSRQKPADTYRVLIFGDRYGVGMNTTAESIFPTILQSFLDTVDRPIEVVNLSYRAGQTPDAYYAYFVNEGLALQPDLILLNINLSSVDALQSHIWRKTDAYGGPTQLHHVDDLVGYHGEWINRETYWYFQIPVLRQLRLFTGIMQDLTPAHQPQIHSMDEAIVRYEQVLNAFKSRADENGIAVYMTVFAPEDSAYQAQLIETTHTIQTDYFFLDLTDAPTDFYRYDYGDMSIDGHYWLGQTLFYFLQPSLQQWNPDFSGPILTTDLTPWQQGNTALCGIFDVNWDYQILLPNSFPNCAEAMPDDVTLLCLNGDGTWGEGLLDTEIVVGDFIQVHASQSGTCGIFVE